MKLIGCHIDNFGAFRNYTLSFNGGLNVIMQANGWGKTTLAAFVKAMLYGFGRKRVRNVAENERLRYKPWQGGKYGGSLDFEANGVEYRVVRTFGATPARDTVRVVRIDTGKSALSETGEDIGEWLFGLDANAFQKSVYVVQNGFGFDGSTAGLRNRLNSLVNEADDVAGFDKAQAKLEERRKYYRRTGNRGAISDVSRDIAKLVDEDAREEARIAELRRIEEEIAGYTASIASLDERIANTQALVERDQASAHQEQALLKVGKQLQERQRETKSAYERATSSVAGKIPTSEEIAKARQSIAELNRLEQEAAVAEESASKVADERATIARKYPNGMPSRRELRDMRGRVATIAAQDVAIAASAPETDEEFERLQSAVAADPTLTRRASESLEGLGEAAATIAEGKAAGNELKTARVQWGERKKRLNLLVDESEEKAAAVPADAQEQSESSPGMRMTFARRPQTSSGSSLDARRWKHSSRTSVQSSMRSLGDERTSPRASRRLTRRRRPWSLLPRRQTTRGQSLTARPGNCPRRSEWRMTPRRRSTSNGTPLPRQSPAPRRPALPALRLLSSR